MGKLLSKHNIIARLKCGEFMRLHFHFSFLSSSECSRLVIGVLPSSRIEKMMYASSTTLAATTAEIAAKVVSPMSMNP